MVKCEWLMDAGAGCVGVTLSIGLKLFQKLGETRPSVSLFLEWDSETLQFFSVSGDFSFPLLYLNLGNNRINDESL